MPMCKELDECYEFPGLCDVNADCINLPRNQGGYKCGACHNGFTGDGFSCSGT